MPDIGRALAALLVCGLSCYGSNAQSQMTGDFITFDPPGSTFTQPSGITPAGVITGYYTDGSGVTHGFLRTLAGAITTFDPPGSKFTQPTAINPAGTIVGSFCPDTACSSLVGFVRRRDGTFTTFGPPGDFIFAGIYNQDGPPPDINPAGLVAGTYAVFIPSFTEHGFLRTPDGTFTTFDPPGSLFTEVLAMNQAGALTGDYCDAVACHGFLRAPDNTVTTFDPPGTTQGTTPKAINPAGAITGANSQVGAFVRNPDGTFALFGVPGAAFTVPDSINPAGAVTGSYFVSTGGPHGFLRAPDGTITTFDPPGSTATWPVEINSASSLIIGSFSDTNGVMHGFLFFPKN
jgi:hypothetical protein